jgi:hypothetical protein
MHATCADSVHGKRSCYTLALGRAKRLANILASGKKPRRKTGRKATPAQLAGLARGSFSLIQMEQNELMKVDMHILVNMLILEH